MSMSKVKATPPPPKPAGAGSAAGAASPKASTPTDAKGDKKKKEKAAESDEDDDTTDKPEKEDPQGVADANQLKAEWQSLELLRAQAAVALQAMESIKADEITKFVDAADDFQLDNLMRVTYEGMKTGKNCPNLLIWHAKITEKAGIGAIMRAMCGKQLSA